MGAEAIKEGDEVAVYSGGIRGNHLEKKVVRRLTTTLLFVEGSDAKFSRKTGHRHGGSQWQGAWVEAWCAKHDDALKVQVRQQAIQKVRRKLSDFKWSSLGDEDIAKFAESLKAAGLWGRIAGE